MGLPVAVSPRWSFQKYRYLNIIVNMYIVSSICCSIRDSAACRHDGNDCCLVGASYS